MTNSSVEAPRAATRKAGIWQAILLLAGSCLPVLGAVLITPILPQLSAVFADQPGAEVLVPMIVAIPALMIAIFAPFAGQIVDRLGRKGLLIIAMVAYAFVGTAPAYLESLQLILLTRVGVGITEAAIMTVCTTLIVDYFHEEKQRNKYLGLQTVATTLAATVFIILGGALGVGGWHTPFWVYAISLVIAVPMVFLLWEPGRGDATDAHVASAGRVPRAVASAAAAARRRAVRRVHVLRDAHRDELPARRERRGCRRHGHDRRGGRGRFARHRSRRVQLPPARATRAPIRAAARLRPASGSA